MGDSGKLTDPPLPYLSVPAKSDRPVGSLERCGDFWVIEAEPYVTEMAKRLFHGSRGNKRGQAIFPAGRRMLGDLNWLLLRFPLEIRDRPAYLAELREASTHIARQEEIRRSPQRIKVPLRVKLKPFQEEGVAFLYHNRRALLADEMGLGKTAQALAFLVLEQAFPALVVVPPHLLGQWPDEIGKFLGSTATHHVIRGQKPYKLPRVHFYFAHYLLLHYWADTLVRQGLVTVIFDEIQELRNYQTAKYAAASKLADPAHVSNVIGLSGTPIHNRGAEIWSVLNIIDFHCLGDRDSFTREWCTYYSGDVVSDPQVLGNYLRNEGLFCRRTKEEVLPELPPKRRVTKTIGMDSSIYGPLIDQAVKTARAAEQATEPLKVQQLRNYAIQQSRQASGIAKAPYVAGFVAALLEAGETVLLFGHHHLVFAEYMKRLARWDPVEISGRVPNLDDRQRAQKSFQEGETNIVVISLRAAAGLNLPRARCVVFGELDWSPAVHSQAEDRAHRIGQHDSVLAYYLVSPVGSDREMQDHLGLKLSQFVGIMGDRETTHEDDVLAAETAHNHMSALLERLRNMKEGEGLQASG